MGPGGNCQLVVLQYPAGLPWSYHDSRTSKTISKNQLLVAPICSGTKVVRGTKGGHFYF
jgi:hypothetical protein